jgi:hypothetical protein
MIGAGAGESNVEFDEGDDYGAGHGLHVLAGNRSDTDHRRVTLAAVELQRKSVCSSHLCNKKQHNLTR